MCLRRTGLPVLFFFLLCGSLSAEERAAGPVEFHRQIAPILKAKCQACHGGSIHESGLWLDSYQKVMQGGADGAIVIPGEAEKSPLFLAASRRAEPAMPPLPNDLRIEALTSDEIELLRRWIDEGAMAGTESAPQTARWRPIPANRRQIYSLALSPDQRTLVVGQGNRIVLYDLLTQQETGRLEDPLLEGVADRDFIQALAFSPDGERIASGGYRNAKLWKRSPPRAAASWNLTHPVRGLKVTEDGTVAAFLLENSDVVFWNRITGERGPVIASAGRTIMDLAFSADENRLITGDAAGAMRIHDVRTGESLGEVQTPSPITAIATRRQGEEVVTAHADSVLRLWNGTALETEPDRSLIKPLREWTGHQQSPTALVLLADSRELLSAGSDQTVRLWNLEQPAPVWTREIPSSVTSLGVSRDGERFVIAGGEGTVRFWNRDGTEIATGQAAAPLVRQLALAGQSLELAEQQQQRAAKKLADAEQDLTERKRLLADAQEKRTQAEQQRTAREAELKPLTEQKRQAEARLAADPENTELQNALKEIDRQWTEQAKQTEEARQAFQVALRGAIHGEQAVQSGTDQVHRRRSRVEQSGQKREATRQKAAMTQQQSDSSGQSTTQVSIGEQDGVVFASGIGEPVRGWSILTGAAIDVPPLPGGNPRFVACLAQGTVLTVDAPGTVVVWDLTPHWTLEATLGPPANDPLNLNASPIVHRVNALAFSPDGTLLATGGGEPSRSGEVYLWTLSALDQPVEFVDAHSDTVLDLQFSRDGQSLVTCGADKFCKFFDVPNRTLMKSFEGHTDHVLGVSLSAGEEWLASGGADRLIKIWDIETGELRRTIDNHSRQVTAVDFVGTTDRILSSGGDSHVKIHVAETGENKRSFIGAQDYVYTVIASRDGQLIIAGGEDGIARVWNAATGEQLFTLQPVKK